MRRHLEIVFEQTGKIPKELEPVPFPDMLTHVWAFFLELNQARSGSGFGANPISYNEILAWAQLTERDLSAFEVSAIKAVDRLFMLSQAKATQKVSND